MKWLILLQEHFSLYFSQPSSFPAVENCFSLTPSPHGLRFPPLETQFQAEFCSKCYSPPSQSELHVSQGENRPMHTEAGIKERCTFWYLHLTNCSTQNIFKLDITSWYKVRNTSFPSLLIPNTSFNSMPGASGIVEVEKILIILTTLGS